MNDFPLFRRAKAVNSNEELKVQSSAFAKPWPLLPLFVAVACLGLEYSALGNPQGMTVGSGTASLNQNGAQMTINAGNNAFINWRSFNIAAGETTTFVQPNSHSVVWNQINDANPSQILGNLNANGFVVLMNQNGFYFGKDSVINVGGFMATSLQIDPARMSSGGAWIFTGQPPSASIVNYGSINVGNGGSLFLISEKVENHGARGCIREGWKMPGRMTWLTAIAVAVTSCSCASPPHRVRGNPVAPAVRLDRALRK